MKKRIGILALIGLVVANTLCSTAFTKELKTTNKDLYDNSIRVYAEGDPNPW